jgi:hypothetical protein
MSKRFNVNPVNAVNAPASAPASAPVSPPASAPVSPPASAPANVEVISFWRGTAKIPRKYSTEEERKAARERSAENWRKLKRALETFVKSKQFRQVLYHKVNDDVLLVYVPIDPKFNVYQLRIDEVEQKLEIRQLNDCVLLPDGARVPEVE